jgi:hypothetical protein
VAYPTAHCPHCDNKVTRTSAFFLGGTEVYCNKCGWNSKKAESNLRVSMWGSWVASGVGVILAATALRGPWGPTGALLIAIPFAILPFGSGLVTRYRISKIPVPHPREENYVRHGALPAALKGDATLQRDDVPLAAKPRVVRFMKRGYLYSLGVALAAGSVLWLLSFGLRGIVSSASGEKAESVFIVLSCCLLLWPCVSFYRNRIRERRLFVNGELSQGVVVTQSSTQLGSRIVYSYRDPSGNFFQNRATDFSRKLFEEMPIHVFYNPLDSRESAALEGSLFRLV